MSTRAATRQASRAPTPTEAGLREAALRHLARYAATQAGLTRVLDRRVERWRRAAGEDAPEGAAAEARAAVRRVVAALVASRVIDDAAYAESRAGLLLRSGRSRRKVVEHLATRGIAAATIAEAVPDDAAHDLAAAVLLARRRKLGCFAASVSADPAVRRRALGILARAGFSHGTASVALKMPTAEAEARIARLRAGDKKTAADPKEPPPQGSAQKRGKGGKPTATQRPGTD